MCIWDFGMIINLVFILEQVFVHNRHSTKNDFKKVVKWAQKYSLFFYQGTISL